MDKKKRYCGALCKTRRNPEKYDPDLFEPINGQTDKQTSQAFPQSVQQCDHGNRGRELYRTEVYYLSEVLPIR